MRALAPPVAERLRHVGIGHVVEVPVRVLVAVVAARRLRPARRGGRGRGGGGDGHGGGCCGDGRGGRCCGGGLGGGGRGGAGRGKGGGRRQAEVAAGGHAAGPGQQEHRHHGRQRRDHAAD